MHSSPASRSNPRPRRKAPIATLAALCALTAGAQTLAPASATAMDDNGGGAECRSVPWAPPGAGWNGTEFCTLTDGSAGGGGGGGASGGDGSGSGGTVGEVIVIVDPYSPPQPTNPLCKSARLCLPGQSGGGRPLGYSDDGRNPREPKGRGSGQAPKKPEAPKGKATPLTKEECRKLEENGTLPPSINKRLIELAEKVGGLESEVSALEEERDALSKEVNDQSHDLQNKFWREYGAAPTPADFVQRLREYHAGRLVILGKQKRISALKDERSSRLEDLRVARNERDRVQAESRRATRTALRKCGAMYDR